MKKGGHNRAELAGLRFGRLLVRNYSHTKNKKAYWACECDCGEIKFIQSSHLKNGAIVSCGCQNRERIIQHNTTHGFANHRFYGTWKDMVRRCTSKKALHYKDYGGRGIKVCEEWREVTNFIAWVDSQGEIPLGHTLDRIDCNANYCPENCKFASIDVQNRNKRNNVQIEYNGETLVFKDFVEKYGVVSYRCASKRVHKLGWDRIEAAITPANEKRSTNENQCSNRG